MHLKLRTSKKTLIYQPISKIRYFKEQYYVLYLHLYDDTICKFLSNQTIQGIIDSYVTFFLERDKWQKLSNRMFRKRGRITKKRGISNM
jgi:hypothetical protein